MNTSLIVVGIIAGIYAVAALGVGAYTHSLLIGLAWPLWALYALVAPSSM